MDDSFNIKKLFAQNIRSKRNALQMSRRQLSLETGISQGYLGDMESGSSIPPIDKGKKIADALGTTLGEMIGESQNEVSLIREDTAKEEIGNIDSSSILYKIFLQEHIFPNGLKYKDMDKMAKEYKWLKKKVAQLENIISDVKKGKE